jgi:hypothetical protein
LGNLLGAHSEHANINAVKITTHFRGEINAAIEDKWGHLIEDGSF